MSQIRLSEPTGGAVFAMSILTSIPLTVSIFYVVFWGTQVSFSGISEFALSLPLIWSIGVLFGIILYGIRILVNVTRTLLAYFWWVSNPPFDSISKPDAKFNIPKLKYNQSIWLMRLNIRLYLILLFISPMFFILWSSITLNLPQSFDFLVENILTQLIIELINNLIPITPESYIGADSNTNSLILIAPSGIISYFLASNFIFYVGPQFKKAEILVRDLDDESPDVPIIITSAQRLFYTGVFSFIWILMCTVILGLLTTTII